MPSAAADLATISDYLTASLPAYRDRTINRIYNGVRDLKRFPYRGPRGKRPGTRELVLPRLPYVVIYRINNECIEVVRVLHGALRR
jgi:toxin ParE1/3/4